MRESAHSLPSSRDRQPKGRGGECLTLRTTVPSADWKQQYPTFQTQIMQHNQRNKQVEPTTRWARTPVDWANVHRSRYHEQVSNKGRCNYSAKEGGTTGLRRLGEGWNPRPRVWTEARAKASVQCLGGRGRPPSYAEVVTMGEGRRHQDEGRHAMAANGKGHAHAGWKQ